MYLSSDLCSSDLAIHGRAKRKILLVRTDPVREAGQPGQQHEVWAGECGLGRRLSRREDVDQGFKNGAAGCAPFGFSQRPAVAFQIGQGRRARALAVMTSTRISNQLCRAFLPEWKSVG